MWRSLFGLVLIVPALASAQDFGWGQLYRLDLLPAFKKSVRIGAVTSYDRTGGNDDGFSGKYSFVEKDGEDLVLAKLEGPGCIYRIHTPTPVDAPLEFYFDGETTPRLSLPCRDLFSGKVAPFVNPLVEHVGGGAYSYVPIPFEKSCKIVLRAKTFQFYDLNYAVYPEGTPIKSYDPKASHTAEIDRARMVFDIGSDLSPISAPAGSRLTTTKFQQTLPYNKPVTLWESNRPGRIAGLKIGPASVLASKDRDLILKITWDGDSKPAVLCPAGDFFGYAWGKPATGGSLVGTQDDMNYCYLPMPYDRSAKIEIISLRPGVKPTVHGEVIVSDAKKRADEGKFYAVWKRENPTTIGQPFTFFKSGGEGHIVGLILQAQGLESGNTYFFEGDDTTTIDGDLVVHGTGSEDFFNGGWYDIPTRWDSQFGRALSGCLGYSKHIGRTGGYRFFLGDAYSYRDSIRQTIEHSPENNSFATDYCSMTYLYSRNRPDVEFSMPSSAECRVIDPATVIHFPHWSMPIANMSFRGVTVSRAITRVGDRDIRSLAFRATQNDFYGPPFLTLDCDLPAPGRYRVYLEAIKGTESGIAQLFQGAHPVGDPVDLYAAELGVVGNIYLGEVSGVEGSNDLTLKVVGKSAEAKSLGMDLVTLRFVRHEVVTGEP